MKAKKEAAEYAKKKKEAKKIEEAEDIFVKAEPKKGVLGSCLGDGHSGE